jgi:hypothetical protein
MSKNRSLRVTMVPPHIGVLWTDVGCSLEIELRDTDSASIRAFHDRLLPVFAQLATIVADLMREEAPNDPA